MPHGHVLRRRWTVSNIQGSPMDLTETVKRELKENLEKINLSFLKYSRSG